MGSMGDEGKIGESFEKLFRRAGRGSRETFPTISFRTGQAVAEPNSSCLHCGSSIDPGRFEGLCPHCLLRMTLSGEPTVPEHGGILPPWLEAPQDGELPPPAFRD